MPPFIPGIELSARYYREAVRPILERRFPGLRHAAALIGPGSEVLGFDTDVSTDHNWGPRLVLYLATEDIQRARPNVDAALRAELPRVFCGFSTSFTPPDEEDGIYMLAPATSGPVAHFVTITTVPAFLERRLGIADWRAIDLLDWLVFSEQRLLEVTTGAVFHDGPGDLERARAALRYYPDDVWHYLLAAQWMRIAQIEPFVGRAAAVGDAIGSAVLAASLARDLMRLCFLIERRYAPYSKWFGTAFARLPCAGRLLPHLQGALSATTYADRERYLTAAYTAVAELHNALGVTAPQETHVRRFHDRPYLVIDGERFARAIQARIADERVRRLPFGAGAIDQFVDSTDVLERNALRLALKAVYTADG
jgi:hypothetical protein